MQARIPPIREFPKDGCIWRIDWLGSVERTASEALIDVFLSPARSGISNPEKQDHFDASVVERIQVGVGQLPFLAIGSLWRDRRRLVRVVGTSLILSDVVISPNTVMLVDAGKVLSENPKRWMIPNYVHAIHGRAMHSRCLAIEYEGDPYGIILPVAEAIRCYYATSTDLAHVVFSGGFHLDLNRIINTADFGIVPGTERMYIKRRRWLADADGWIIGRVLGSPLAAAGVARVYDSLLRSVANATSAFPECGLPFEGCVQWRARGVGISRGNDQGCRFLIHELLRCSAPFPFRELHVDADNNSDPADDPDKDLPEEEKKLAWATPRKTAKHGPDDELQSDLPPAADIGTVQVLQLSDRFDDIAGKEIIRTPKEQCRYKSVTLRRPLGIDALGTGQGAWADNEVAPLRAEWKREEGPTQRKESLTASFEALNAVVDALNRLNGLSARVRPITQRTEFLRLTEPSGYRQWGYLDSAKRRRRRVMVIDIESSKAFGCLIEYERRKSERSRLAMFVARQPVGVSEISLIRILDGLVSVEGVWANLEFYPDSLNLMLFNHSRPSAEKFAMDLGNSLLAPPR